MELATSSWTLDSIPMTAELSVGWGSNIGFFAHYKLQPCVGLCVQWNEHSSAARRPWRVEAQGTALVLVSISETAAWVKAGTDSQSRCPMGLPERYGTLGTLPPFWGYGISAGYSRLPVILWSCETKLLSTWLSTFVVSRGQSWQGLACVAFASQPFQFVFHIQDLPCKTRNGLFCCMLCQKCSLPFFLQN